MTKRTSPSWKVWVSALAILGLAACEATEETETPSSEAPVESSQVVVTPGKAVPGGPVCSVPSTLSAAGGAVVASVPENACMRLRLCVDPAAWKDLPQNTYVPGIDIVILFDVTGSMFPYIEAMIRNVQRLIDNLSAFTPSLRLGLASYRDFGDRSGTPTDWPYKLNVALTTDTRQVRDALGTLRARGGGDLPESLATAVKAVVDGQGQEPYFGPKSMGFDEDPSRIKIVLGVTDAMNRREDLPSGVPGLEQVAALLKEKGVLFLGIGYKSAKNPAWDLATGSAEESSFDDLAYLARMTGAIVKSPGVDLDGDGKTSTYGELAPGAPAVLLMTPGGQLQGAHDSSNSTRILADAITELVKRVKPFQFSLALQGEGRSFQPLTNSVTVHPDSAAQACFTPVRIGARSTPAPGACPVPTEIRASVSEELSSVSVDPTLLKAVLEVIPGCVDTAPEPEPLPTPTPTAPPICVGPGCGGGVIGL